MNKTRFVLDGHVNLFGFSVPLHFTVDVPDHSSVPVSIPQIHFSGLATAIEIAGEQQPLPLAAAPIPRPSNLPLPNNTGGA